MEARDLGPCGISWRVIECSWCRHNHTHRIHTWSPVQEEDDLSPPLGAPVELEALRNDGAKMTDEAIEENAFETSHLSLIATLITHQ